MLASILIIILLILQIVLVILRKINKKNKTNKNKLSYIEADDIEKKSKEIDDFVRKHKCIIPKE